MRALILFASLLLLASGCTQHNPKIGTSDMVAHGDNAKQTSIFVVVAPGGTVTAATDQRPVTDTELPFGLNGGSAASGSASALSEIVNKVVKEAVTEDKPAVVVPVDKPTVSVPVDKPEVVVADKPKVVAEEKLTVSNSILYNGLTNGDRPTYYFGKPLSTFPRDIYLTVPGLYTDKHLINGTRADGKGAGYTESSGFIMKQSDVAGRGMTILLPKGSPAPAKISVRY